MNWQKEHERIEAEMDRIAGAKIYNLAETLAQITDADTIQRLLLLNKMNDHAVDMAEKQS